MEADKKKLSRFLTSPSTYWVTLVRLGLIILPYIKPSVFLLKSFYSPSFSSVMIRPHQSLPHLEEAYAISALASSNKFSTYYLANNSIQIPPLLLVAFSPLMKTGPYVGLCFSFLLLLIDILISYLIEQIGNRLLGLSSTSQSSNEDSTGSQKLSASEECIQQRLPDKIRPAFSHIFPVYVFGDGKLKRPLQSDLSRKEDLNSTRDQEPMIPLRNLPLLAAQIYYYSPFTALPTSLFHCWQNITSLFLVASLYESICSASSCGSLSMASFYLAIATYLEPHYIAYVIPIILLSSFNGHNRFTSSSVIKTSIWNSKTAKPAMFVIMAFSVWSLLLQWTSYALVGPENYWKVLASTYGSTWLVSSPNLSLQWYFRMQIFSRFRDYFGAIYAGIPFVMIGPLCLRFHRYPELLVSVATFASRYNIPCK